MSMSADAGFACSLHPVDGLVEDAGSDVVAAGWVLRDGDAALRVVADDRESGSGVVQALAAIPGVDVRVARLARGDFEVDGRCLFERKTIVDFAASIKDGRLFRQAWRLKASGSPGALIIEGRGTDLAATGMGREALQGALITLALVFDLPVLRSLDAGETARLLLYAGQQLRRQSLAAVTAHGRRPKRRRRIQLRMLQALPGIGPLRAGQLLEHFGSVQRVVSANASELEVVSGIGPRTAEAICWALEPEAGEAARPELPGSARGPAGDGRPG
jgi:ERCC4-type nuclease